MPSDGPAAKLAPASQQDSGLRQAADQLPGNLAGDPQITAPDPLTDHGPLDKPEKTSP